MKQFRALNFENFRMGKGGMNFCSGRGCLVNLRSANYLVNGCKKEASGIVIYRMWGGGGKPTVGVSLFAD